MWQVAISPKSGLPRFNMPFEAGIAYSLHEGGVSGGAPHHMLLLDKAPYRIQVSMSDAAGIDGRRTRATPSWRLKRSAASSAARADARSLGGKLVSKRYALFLTLLRRFVRPHLTVPEVKSWGYVNDMQAIMAKWDQEQPSAALKLWANSPHAAATSDPLQLYDNHD
ncbi:MAG: hypothetical protein M3Y22_16105 [Pseudomonadota bacterium]|nr:hypothetical protein [Pseudomonadota bacterium]